MLKRRIIPCLDIKNGRTVKGINFEGLRDAGDPVELALRYVEEGADELVFLDISATEEKRATLLTLVERIAKNVSIPFTVGGGINSVSDVSKILGAGADKISVNSAAVKNPLLLEELAATFGSQCVVIAIDSKNRNGEDVVFVSGGKIQTHLRTLEWAKKAVSFGAGEILLTSMDKDGTKEGFDIPLLQKVCENISVPVIASGGAGTFGHFSDLFHKTKATGGLAASVFHFGEIYIPDLKNELKINNIPVR
jgi:imidazole glycerol-phosphate synthase subunit HisF